jgi:hypothetical protein
MMAPSAREDSMSEQTESTPFAGDVANYSLAEFTTDLRTELAPAGIELELIEDGGGTRTVRAWQLTEPEAVAVFPIDDLRILPYQASIVAMAIRRSFVTPGSTGRDHDRPAVSDAASSPVNRESDGDQ